MDVTDKSITSHRNISSKHRFIILTHINLRKNRLNKNSHEITIYHIIIYVLMTKTHNKKRHNKSSFFSNSNFFISDSERASQRTLIKIFSDFSDHTFIFLRGLKNLTSNIEKLNNS